MGSLYSVTLNLIQDYKNLSINSLYIWHRSIRAQSFLKTIYLQLQIL